MPRRLVLKSVVVEAAIGDVSVITGGVGAVAGTTGAPLPPVEDDPPDPNNFVPPFGIPPAPRPGKMYPDKLPPLPLPPFRIPPFPEPRLLVTPPAPNPPFTAPPFPLKAFPTVVPAMLVLLIGVVIGLIALPS